MPERERFTRVGVPIQAPSGDKSIRPMRSRAQGALLTDAERAALALSEAVTRMPNRSDPVPDAVWDEAAKHYDEKGLGALVLWIATTNLYNRINVTTRQPAGKNL
jgi:alkylhydroperoxidase family enzyme